MAVTTSEIETLHKNLTTLQNYGVPFPEIPEYIKSNIKEGFGVREYQQEAIRRFLYWWESSKRTQNRFLYHMATGSGKTLVMAELILELYKKGYSNFIFFVHLDNIVQKTKKNFLDPTDPKYLFAQNINIDGKQVKIKEVENFDAANEEDINIIFSTIAGLHTKLRENKEDSITFEDFEDKKIVLISDEAHHLNADTKGGQTEADLGDKPSWEGTANRIFNSNKENVMLEFTATADLGDPNILQKYKDVLIFDYPLHKFREEGYSKEVMTLEFASENIFERALQAMILSQYRLKIFQNHQIGIKPVVLFKANYVNEPTNPNSNTVVSEKFQEEFHQKLSNLKADDLERIKAGTDATVMNQAFEYFEKNGITLENLAWELKREFAEEKCINVNTKAESINKQVEVNNLENNQYRGVFAVEKLNEGWDVLNLFDIVRLYNTTPGKTQKPGETTVKEAQLIGRGARYCNFKIEEDQPEYQRKYDDDLENPLRVCETMYYHCQTNPKYIEELRTALKEEGLIDDKVEEKSLQLKSSFKESRLYKTGFYFSNEREEYKRKDVNGLDDTIKEKRYRVTLPTRTSREVTILQNEKDAQDTPSTQTITLGKHIDKKVIRFALNKIKFYNLDHLKSYFPNLTGIEEFITSPDYLSEVKVDVTGAENQIKNPNPDEQLSICMTVLLEIADKLPKGVVIHKGTKKFKPKAIKSTFKDKKVKYNVGKGDGQGIPQSSNSISSDLYLDIPNQDWFAFDEEYGTNQEKYLVRFIHNYVNKLKKKFDAVYLLRNERFVALYSFEDGSRTDPDYLLFLEQEKEPQKVMYQLFIEPKGEHLINSDSWKEDFLKSIEKEHETIVLEEDRDYKLFGMPFYHEDLRKGDFEDKFFEITNIYE
jgi:type III restriction enzyme